MIEELCPSCGAKTLLPDPPERLKTPMERIEFEKQWDARVKAGRFPDISREHAERILAQPKPEPYELPDEPEGVF